MRWGPQLWVFFWLQIFARIPEPIRGQMYLQDRNHTCDWCSWRPIFDLSSRCTSDYALHKILECKNYRMLSKIQLDLSHRRKRKEFRGESAARLILLYLRDIQFQIRYFPLLDEEERMWIPMQKISGEDVNVNCI